MRNINLKNEWKLEENKYACPFCDKVYSKKGICSHIWRNHTDAGRKFDPFEKYTKNGLKHPGWNKGLTAEVNESVKKYKEKLKDGYKSGRLIPPFLGRPLTEDHKKKISSSMKKAHAEGRAWNIGKSRWNNEPSYPEKFFMKIIENEFYDKEYIREHPVGIYSLDFAWISKKKAIEIDGAQHERFEEYKNRDKRKMNFLKENGWSVVRISWKVFCNNTQDTIKMLKNFIDL